MVIKGLLLLGDIRANGYDMYLVTVSEELWGTDVLALLSSKAASLVGRVEDIRDIVLELNGESTGLPAVTDVIAAFPVYLDEGLPFQAMSSLLRSGDIAYTPFGAKLAYVAVTPVFDVVVSATPLSVSACYCGTVKATYYREQTTKPVPYLPYLPSLFRLPTGRLYLPSYVGFSGYMKVYAAENHAMSGHSIAWLQHYDAWYNVPESETWHYRHTSKELTIEGSVDPVNSVRIDIVIRDSDPYLTGSYNADYPVDTGLFTRQNYFGSSELSMLCDGESGRPLLDTMPDIGIYIPSATATKSSFGGVLACAAGLNSIFFPEGW